jgi:hypothetical protein
MKTIRIFFLLAAITLTAGLFNHASAQGNLQFNQVILLTVPLNSSITFNVPAGKVWKIESVGVGGASNTSLILRDSGGNNVAYFFGATSDNNVKCPFWLPSSFSGSFISTGTNPYRDIISIIEFNVVP